MDQKDAEFLARLSTLFQIEAEEHIQAISNGLLRLEQHANSFEEAKEIISSIYREAHSLKGAARAVNQETIQGICQAMESVFYEWKDDKLQPSGNFYNILHTALDYLKTILSSPQPNPDKDQLEKITFSVQTLLNGTETSGPSSPYQCSPKNEASPSRSLQENPPSIPHEIKQFFDRAQPKTCVPLPHQSPPMKIDPPSDKEEFLKQSPSLEPKKNMHTIRFSSEKLDHILQQAEELLVIKLGAKRQLEQIKDAQTGYADWVKREKRSQSSLLSLKQRMESSEDFTVTQQDKNDIKRLLELLSQQSILIKSLFEKWSKYVKQNQQDARIFSGMVDSLIEETKKALMQPFSTLLESFPRMVRDISQSLGKEVKIEFQGGDIELDRRILEEIKDPLMHLVRNCLDHGIELPVERVNHQKPSQGTIKITASQTSGNNVEIVVSDDGKGINRDQLKSAAKQKGLNIQRNLETLSDEETLRLIFYQGVSTSPIITELSGRGLGMGIVAEKVEKLGGRMHLESTPLQGTIFKIILPLTLATFRGIHICACERDFIVPTHYLKKVLRIHLEDIQTVENCETVVLDRVNLPYLHLGDLLNLPRNIKAGEKNKFIYILVIKAVETTICIGVDKLISEQEVFLKSLGKQLASLRNISAATIQESGTIIPILNPFDLVKSALQRARVKQEMTVEASDRRSEPQTKLQTSKTILIAEDSATARTLLQNILHAAGYLVKTAVDGTEALRILQTEKIDLLLSDVEMPRLTGFALTKKLREAEEFRNLPIILCTALDSKEDREYGIEVGANAYITKSAFTQSHLLDSIHNLLERKPNEHS